VADGLVFQGFAVQAQGRSAGFSRRPAKAVTTNQPAKAVTTNQPAKAVTTNQPAKAVTTNRPAKAVTTNKGGFLGCGRAVVQVGGAAAGAEVAGLVNFDEVDLALDLADVQRLGRQGAALDQPAHPLAVQRVVHRLLQFCPHLRPVAVADGAHQQLAQWRRARRPAGNAAVGG
jgi:hypothetical protein